jgi:hypothetical protein
VLVPLERIPPARALQAKERRQAREAARAKAEEERAAWAAVQEALPSKEEMERIAKDTDPEEFLSELRLVSDNMERLERGQPRPPPQDAGASAAPAGVSFAKKGFLTAASGTAASETQPHPAAAAAASPATPSLPEHTLKGVADESGEATMLELCVKLPGVAEIGMLELDISTKLVRARNRRRPLRAHVCARPMARCRH